MKNSNHYVSRSQTAESFCCYFDYAYGLTICKFTKDCLLSAVTESPVSSFSEWYASAHYDYLTKGAQ